MNRTRRAGQIATGVLFVILASGLILAGCNEDEATFADITGSGPAEAEAVAGGAIRADWSEVQKAATLSETQLEPMRASYDGWQSATDRREGMTDFLTESSRILERDQFLELVVWLGDRAEEERADRREARQAARGEDRRERRGSRGESIRELAGELGISAEQQTQLREVFEAHREAMDELRESNRSEELSRGEFREAHDALRAEAHESMLAVLTEEQAAAFEERRETRRAERMEERLERFANSDRDEKRVAFLTTVLDLDDAQSAQLASILAEERAARLALMQEELANAGSGDMRDPEARDERREAMRTLHEQTKAAIEGLLTDDQREVYDALENLRGKPGAEGAGHFRGPRRGGNGRS